MKKILAVIAILFFSLTAFAAQCITPALKIEDKSIPNFFKVSDGLYRSAQPLKEGFIKLPDYGIKTVLNLRADNSDAENLAGLGLNYEQIKINTWAFNEKDIDAFLRIIADEDNLPLLVHCQHGADRTGVMAAVYRIVVEDWSKEEALAEMTGGCFGFHSIWLNLPKLIKSLDVEKLKANYAAYKQEAQARRAAVTQGLGEAVPSQS